MGGGRMLSRGRRKASLFFYFLQTQGRLRVRGGGKRSLLRPGRATSSIVPEVPLLLALVPDLSEGEGEEEPNVPGQHVNPERVGEARAGGELGEALRDGLVQPVEQARPAEAAHGDGARDRPPVRLIMERKER